MTASPKGINSLPYIKHRRNILTKASSESLATVYSVTLLFTSGVVIVPVRPGVGAGNRYRIVLGLPWVTPPPVGHSSPSGPAHEGASRRSLASPPPLHCPCWVTSTAMGNPIVFLQHCQAQKRSNPGILPRSGSTEPQWAGTRETPDQPAFRERS